MKIFSADFNYHIPAYQRPYAWTEEQAESLFDDLFDFYKNEAEDNYFLGSIVLIKDESNPQAEVIDGQQRLTTLTIMIAVIASHLTGETRNNCNKYLREPGNDLEGLSPLPRLHLRDKDQAFFEKYVQDVKVHELINLGPEAIDNESKEHIRANCDIILKKIEQVFNNNEEEIKKFCQFIVTRCYLVVVYTASQQSAFRVFSVMNSRGLDLLPIDIIKADIIGKIPLNEQQSYTEKWEDLEIQTTRAGFNDVFAHTRMIFAKAKAKRNLLEEFREFVVSQTTPKGLIDEILEPYADTYTMVKNSRYIATNNAKEINDLLIWLNRIDNSDWVPVAIKFLSQQANNSDYTLWFINRLERLASCLYVTAKGVNQRIERYKRILDEMDQKSGHNINNKLNSVELTDEEKREFIDTLNSDIYLMPSKRRNYIILRLDSFVSCGGASYITNILTIEHVLPQTIKVGTEWEKLWPDSSIRDTWQHKIGNLVPLGQRHNSGAKNFDFDIKKKIYFTGKYGTSSYSLTTQVINETSWIPSVVEKRQAYLLDVFKKNWDI